MPRSKLRDGTYTQEELDGIARFLGWQLRSAEEQCTTLEQAFQANPVKHIAANIMYWRHRIAAINDMLEQAYRRLRKASKHGGQSKRPTSK